MDTFTIFMDKINPEIKAHKDHRRDKQNVYLYKGISFSRKKGDSDTCYNMGGLCGR